MPKVSECGVCFNAKLETAPPWCKTLEAVNAEQRSVGQRRVSIALDELKCICHVLIYCPKRKKNKELSRQEIIQVLGSVVLATSQGSIKNLRYLTTEKEFQSVIKDLRDVCSDLINQDINTRTLSPEKIVVMQMAAVASAGVALYFELARGNPADTIQRLADSRGSLLERCTDLIDLGQSSPSFKRKCDEFLQEQVDSRLNHDTVRSILDQMMSSLSCLLHSYSINYDDPLVLTMHGHLLDEFYNQVKFISEAQLMSQYAYCESFDYQFKLLAECQRELISNKKVSTTNPNDLLNKEWWKAAGIYIKMLKKAASDVKKLVPAEPFLVVFFNSMLFYALGAGACKTVSYTEFEQLAAESEAALKECSAWIPPFFKLERATEIKLVKAKILPFIRKRKPLDYQTAPLDVFTKGFLSLYTSEEFVYSLYSPENVHKCACCGVRAVDLLKCLQCKSVYYCDSDCQKEHWKVHKKECKKAEKAPAGGDGKE